jgi:two-component system sensor histidine kinase VanS
MKTRSNFKSVRFKLFLTLCFVIAVIVLCLVAINSIVLESFYLYSKTQTVKGVYEKINNYYNLNGDSNIEDELQRIAFNNNFDIFIETDQNVIVFSTNRDFYTILEVITDTSRYKDGNQDSVIYQDEEIRVEKINDQNNNISYILLSGRLDNGYHLYISMPTVPIEESVEISNQALIVIGLIILLISAFIASYISKKFTNPIVELNDITNKMARLDFSQKYRIADTDDEINELGKNINTMSDKLEGTIKQLRENNSELEKDIEEKSKIDEMRKQFISDVSHELKTPIALIQGYAEGLLENVNTDDESRKFYAEVILDESNKMDTLVKQLLELMKLEYGKREFNNETFNIVELINEVIRKCKVMIEEKNITIDFEANKPVMVNADDFYIEQVVTNYFTNAIKHTIEVNKEKKIKITIEEKDNKIRVSVFNTGNPIPEEHLNKIWGRFYKEDTSRNRTDGGTGIGLALVKAIMNNYKNDYGVINKENGVEFYFELDKEAEEKEERE